MTFALLAAALPDHPGLGDNLRYQIVGFMIVMLVLATLWVLIRTVGEFFERAAARSKPVPAKASAAIPGGADAPLPPEIVAVIAAAVHAVGGASHRIVSVHPVAARQSAVNINAWSVEGRRQIFSSHSVR